MSEHDVPTAGQVNASAAEVYEAFFVPALFAQWPQRVLDAAGVRAGDAVLDVGCGTGALARVAAERLAGSGSVVGVDGNDGMLAVARRSPEPVTWRHGWVEDLPFPDRAFDRVVSQFALMFFAEPEAGLTEMARVTRPGGTMAIATWAGVDQSPGYAAMIELVDELVGPEAAAALGAPFSLGSEPALAALISPILPDVSVVRHEGMARFDSLEAWVHTDVRGWTLDGMVDDDRYAALLEAARTDLADFVDPDGRVRFPAPALIAAGTPGRRPDPTGSGERDRRSPFSSGR